MPEATPEPELRQPVSVFVSSFRFEVAAVWVWISGGRSPCVSPRAEAFGIDVSTAVKRLKTRMAPNGSLVPPASR